MSRVLFIVFLVGAGYLGWQSYNDPAFRTQIGLSGSAPSLGGSTAPGRVVDAVKGAAGRVGN
ncbi:MAG: hypothetical protein AAGF74_10335 [Pseudomonadota bacterium]